jgi:hypothetical protein
MLIFLSILLVFLVALSPSIAVCNAPVPAYIGDGFCDNLEYNNEDCDWDGGDCCLETCSSGEYDCGYSSYNCLNPGVTVPPTPSPPTRSPTYFGCNVAFPERIGDGFCDYGEYNIAECLYDGGDCCEDTCVSTPRAACGSNGYGCHLDTAAPSTKPTLSPTSLCTATNLKLIGDGFCDGNPEYNNALCDWDGGDCCSHTCVSNPNPCGSNGFFCLEPEFSNAPTALPTRVPTTAVPSTGFPSTATPSTVMPTVSKSPTHPSTAPTSPPTAAPTSAPSGPCFSNCFAYRFVSAVFNKEGTEVLLTFDGPTDQGGRTGQFSCSAVASFEGAPAATCVWLTSSTLAARLGSEGAVVDSIVTVLGGILRRANTPDIEYASALYMNEMLAAVQAPASPQPPVVALLALANVINKCDNIRIDASQSTGQGSNDWLAVSWAVSGSGVTNETTILSELANYNNDLSTPISFSNAGFSDGTVSIVLTLVNFLGVQSSATVTVVVTDQIVPAVSIIGGSEQSLSNNNLLSLQAQSFIPACLAGQISTLSYRWSILNMERSPLPIVSTSHNPSRFSLLAFALDIASYYVVVTAAPNAGIAATYEVFLHVVSAGARAAVRGGLTRTASVLSAFSLDASASYHPSYPADPSTVLFYAWSCARADGTDCGLGALQSIAVLDFAAAEIPSSSQAYVFTVVVTSNKDTITSAARVAVTVVTYALPLISIEGVQTRYSPQAAVSVGGVLGPLESSESYKFSWSVSPAVGKLANSSVLALMLSDEVPEFQNFPISFFANQLTAGVTYTLTLRAAFADSPAAVAMSSVDIRMNTPPYVGKLTVTPSLGVSLVTVFLVASRGWVIQPDSYPVMYTLSASSDGATSRVVLSRSLSTFYRGAHLPPGLAANGHVVTCSARAVDVYGSTSAAVTATAAVLSAGALSDVAALIDTLIVSAKATQNSDLLEQTISIGASNLNYADCGTVDCPALNREYCSTTHGTCGDCLSNYIGVDGHSNEPCSSVDGGERRLINTECTLADPSCHKKCPNDCSAAGTCVAYNFANDAIDFCPVNDLNCRVSCACDAGSYGSSCALGEAEYRAALRSRDALCFTYYQSLQFQDVSSEIVSSRLALASLILLDSAQISMYALTNCTTVVTETVEQYPDLAAAGDIVAVVVQALSLALNSKDLMSTGLLNATHAAVDTLLSAAQSLSSSPLDVITRNIRVSSLVQSARDIQGGGVLLTVPTTLFEISLNTQVAQVVLANNDLTDADPDTFGLSIVQYTNNPSGFLSNSSVVRVRTTYNVTDANSGDKSLNFIIVLQNTVQFNYASETLDNVTVSCDVADTPYTVSANCSGSLYSFTCPGNETGEIVYSCPYFTESPVCDTHGEGGTVCSVQSYTDSSTTCVCAMPLDVITIGNKYSASSFGTGLLVVSNNFLYTWRSVTRLTADDVLKNAVIFGIMVGLICALVIGLIYFGYRDIENVAGKHRAQEEVALSVSAFFDKVIPKQFEESAWPVRFMKVLSERHSYLCFLFPLAEDDYRTSQWLNLMGKLINYVFVGTILTVFFFGDDGTCERQSSKSLCLALKGPDFETSVCGWNERYDFCEYVAPPETFLTLIILALTINVLCVPLDVIVYFACGNYKALLTYYSQLRIQEIHEEDKMARAADPEAYPYGEVMNPVMHELKAYPTRRATLIRAARLTKMQQQMDHVDVNTEVAIIMEYNQGLDAATAQADATSAMHLLADYVTPKRLTVKEIVMKKAAVGRHLLRQGVTGKNAFDGRAAIKTGKSMTDLSRDRSAADLTLPKIESDENIGMGSKLEELSYQQLLRRNVKLARARAEKIRHRIQLLGSEERKEIYLVRKFLVDNMIGVRRLVANRFFFGSFNDEFAYARKNITYLKVVAVLFPLYLAVICLYIFLYGVTLGSRSTSLWMISIGVSYLQDILLLETCSLYMVNVVLVSIVYKDLKLLSRRLRKRAKAILNRVHGQMSLARCYLQHLNAACRAARSLPELGMSRLLMSLNDLDMPKAFVPRYHHPHSKWYFIISGLVVIKNFFVLMYLSLPDSFQDAIIETLVCCALNLFFIAIYLGTVVSGDNAAIAGIFIFFLIVIILLLPWTKSFRSYLWNLVFPRAGNEKYDGDDDVTASDADAGEEEADDDDDELFECEFLKDVDEGFHDEDEMEDDEASYEDEVRIV